MSDRQDWNPELSSFLKNIYRCVDKSSWYNAVAEAYDRTRPRYPAPIWAFIQEIAQLQQYKSVLEIGSGPGIASIELAKLGANIVCLEPSKSACELARRKCVAYPNLEVINSTFEEWELGNQKFDAVIATTSFHWIAPEIRNQKTAAALKDQGLPIMKYDRYRKFRQQTYLNRQILTRSLELLEHLMVEVWRRNNPDLNRTLAFEVMQADVPFQFLQQ